jgi:hypothetical protein
MRNRRGQILPLVLVVLSLIIAFVAIRTFLGDSDLVQARHLIWHNQGTYIAEGGLQLGLLAFERAEGSGPWIFDLGGNDVLVEEVVAEGYLIELRATAKVGDVTVVKSALLKPPLVPGGHP